MTLTVIGGDCERLTVISGDCERLILTVISGDCVCERLTLTVIGRDCERLTVIDGDCVKLTLTAIGGYCERLTLQHHTKSLEMTWLNWHKLLALQCILHYSFWYYCATPSGAIALQLLILQCTSHPLIFDQARCF